MTKKKKKSFIYEGHGLEPMSSEEIKFFSFTCKITSATQQSTVQKEYGIGAELLQFDFDGIVK